MSISVPSLPRLVVQPPTPLNLTPSRQFESTLSYLPLDFLGSLDESEAIHSASASSSSSSSSAYPPCPSSASYLADDDSIDHSLLSPPRLYHRKRRLSSRKPQERQSSFVGLSLVVIAAIVLFTSVASLSSPLHALSEFANEEMGTGISRAGKVFNRKLHSLPISLQGDVNGGSLWRDMTLGDILGQSAATMQSEQEIPKRGALSTDAWKEYRRRRESPTSTFEFWISSSLNLGI